MAFPAHVLLLNVYFAPHSYGGATVVAEAVARQLVAQGVRVTAVSVMNRLDLVPYAVMRTEVAGITNYLINLPPGRTYVDHYDNSEVTERVDRLIEELAPDLIHAHCVQEMGAGPIEAAKQRGVPVVLSVHDFWWLCEFQFMIRPDGAYCGQNPVRIEGCRGCVDDLDLARDRVTRLKDIAGMADLITYPSRFARDLSVDSGFPGDRSRVWENGVTLPGAGFFQAQAARRAADSRLVFGFLGGPSQIKGWPLVRAAFEGIGRDDFAGFLVDASLTGDWWKGITISKMRGDWQIHPRFTQEGIDDFYAKIDVLLFPSQWKETFGLTIREAAARGIRVIQTASGGTTEWAGADPARMLTIGDGPAPLQAQIAEALDTPDAHPAPVAVTGYAGQARAFLDLVAPLVPQPA